VNVRMSLTTMTSVRTGWQIPLLVLDKHITGIEQV
jgi:hypothetical protein